MKLFINEPTTKKIKLEADVSKIEKMDESKVIVDTNNNFDEKFSNRVYT